VTTRARLVLTAGFYRRFDRLAAAATRHGVTLRHKGHKAHEEHENPILVLVIFVFLVAFVLEREAVAGLRRS